LLLGILLFWVLLVVLAGDELLFVLFVPLSVLLVPLRLVSFDEEELLLLGVVSAKMHVVLGMQAVQVFRSEHS
jgi:hypothetical protein